MTTRTPTVGFETIKGVEYLVLRYPAHWSGNQISAHLNRIGEVLYHNEHRTPITAEPYKVEPK